MNSFNIQPASSPTLLLWFSSFKTRLINLSRVSAWLTTFRRRPSLPALATKRSTTVAGRARYSTAKQVFAVLSSLPGPSSSATSMKPAPANPNVWLKPKLWYAQFGAEKAHFESHIRNKPLKVVAINNTTLTCTDQAGESWIVFPEWVDRIEAKGQPVWQFVSVYGGFNRLEKVESKE